MSEEKRVTRSQTEQGKLQLPGDLGEQIALIMQTKLDEHDKRTEGAFVNQMDALQEQMRNITDLVMDSRHPVGEGRAQESPAATPVVSHRDKDRRVPQSFDGTSSWRAYFTQFNLIASQNRWTEEEKAMQLAASLKGPALEILGHLPEVQCRNFERLTEALNQRFGVEHQEEAFRAQFRTRFRRPQENLAELAQDIEKLAYLAYPSAPAEFRDMLIRDQFIDALDDTELKISVRQTRPSALKDALGCALEFESIRRSVKSADTTGSGSSGFKTRVASAAAETSAPQESVLQQILQAIARIERIQRATGEGAAATGSVSDHRRRTDVSCWNCGRQGHLQRNCRLPTRGGRNQRSQQSSQSTQPEN